MTDESKEDRHGIGGNRPPPLIVATVAEVNEHWGRETAAMRDRLVAVGNMRDRFVEATPQILDEEGQRKATDVVAQIKTHIRAVEDVKEKAKRPWIDGGRAVDALFKELAALVGSTAKIEQMQTAFAREKAAKERAAAAAAAKKAQEEADRRAAEAAEDLTSEALDAAEDAATRAAHASALAASKPAELSRVQSDYGASSSLTRKMVIRCTNIDLVPSWAITFNESAVRERAMTAHKKKQEFTVPGVEITWEETIRNYAPR